MNIIRVVNDYHSSLELEYKQRWIVPILRSAIAEHQIIVLTGARQVGKSTLLQNELPFSDWRYITLNDFDALSQARTDPTALWAGTDRIVLDEVQKSSILMEAVKAEVDSNPDKYRFVLSGSANLLLMKKVSESLAGRAIYFILNPMTLGEMNSVSPTNLLRTVFEGQLPEKQEMRTTELDPFPLMWRGFMPFLMQLKTPEAIVRWWEGYVRTYLERDLRELSQIASLPNFRRLMAALAHRSGRILNQTEVSRDIALTQPSIHRYINLLETTFLLERLPAFTVNRTKRLIKSPKVMWRDPGLVSFLSGHYDSSTVESSREAGGIFETMIFLHLSALSQLLTPKPHIFYWRTTTGKEVDFVIEWGRKLLAIEVKLSNNPRFSHTESLRLFLEEYPETSMCILFHTGNEVRIMHEKIVAVPWHFLLAPSL